MRTTSIALTTVFLLASTRALADDQGLPQKLDVETAVQRALALQPGLEATRARQRAADAQADSVRGRLLPTIVVSDEQQHYNAPFIIPFGPLSFEARNVNTNTFVAAANQPVLGLLHLTQDHAALSDMAAASDEQVKSVESMVREQMETGFLRYHEALSLVAVAKSSEDQLAEQRKLAEQRLAAGVITNADVLRIVTAQANAKLQEVQAQTQADASKSAILVTLGYPTDVSGVELLEPTQLIDAAAPKIDDATAQRQAETNRHEVAAAKLQLNAADHQQHSSLYKLLPEADLEAAYVHITGQIFAPEDSGYVGVKASWPIFTWGADWFSFKAAQAQADAAAHAADDQARTVRIDAAQKLDLLRATESQVDLANSAIASAEEAYRVTTAQVKAGVATSTSDLLDAQSQLTQAKLSLTRAKYERAIATVALHRATNG